MASRANKAFTHVYHRPASYVTSSRAHMPVYTFHITAVILIALFYPALHVQAQDTEAVFAQLLERYAAVDGLQASFTHVLSSTFWDEDQIYSGRLIVHGDQYRIDTDHSILLMDGESTYIYRIDEKQVLISDVEEDLAAFIPSTFLLDMGERFDAIGMGRSIQDGAPHYRLDLKPKSADSFFSALTIWMRAQDAVITRVRIIDTNDTHMALTLDNIELNPQIGGDTFVLTPPPDAEIIDLRS